MHIRSVGIQHVLGFLGDIQQLRHTALHAKRQFILRYARGDFRITNLRQTFAVKRVQPIQCAPAGGGVHSRRVGKIQDRIAVLRNFTP